MGDFAHARSQSGGPSAERSEGEARCFRGVEPAPRDYLDEDVQWRNSGWQ